MVCLPCFIIPLLLWIWHRFVQPILLRYWNPWQKKDAQGNIIKAGPDFPFECKGGVCPFVPGNKKDKNDENEELADDAAAEEMPGTASKTEAMPKTATVTAGESKKQN